MKGVFHLKDIIENREEAIFNWFYTSLKGKGKELKADSERLKSEIRKAFIVSPFLMNLFYTIIWEE